MSAPTLSDSNPKLKIVKTEVRPTGEAVQLVRPLAEGTKSTDQIVGELVSKFDYKTQSVKAGEAELNAVQKAFGANLAEELIKTYDGSNLVSDLQQDLIGEKYLAEQIKRIHEQQKTTSILDKWSHLLYEGEKDESSPSQFAVHNYVAGTYRSSGSHHSLINPQQQSQQSYQIATQSQSSQQPVQSEAQFQASSRLSRAQSGSVISSGSQKSLHASQREALEQARQAALAQQEQALRAQALAQEQARIQQALEEEEKQSRIRYYAQVEAQAKSLQEREARQQAEAQAQAQAQARAQQQYEEQQRQQQQQQQHQQAFYFHQESRQQQHQQQQQQASPSYGNSSNSFQQPQPYLPQLSSSNLNSITLDAYNSPEFKAMLEQLTKPLSVPPEQVNYPPEWPSQDKINLLAEPIYIPAPQPIVIPAPNILFLQNDNQDNASQQQVSENILERLRPTVAYYPQVQKNDEAHMQNYGLRQIHVEGNSSRSGF